MAEHTYKIEEVVGSSTSGIEDAIQGAVARAAKSTRNLAWFQVTEIRGHIESDKIAHYQVSLKLGFTLDA